jgi:cell division protein FtsL
MSSVRLWALVLGAALFVSMLSIVSAQYRARSLFVDLEAAQQEARRLDAEASRLRVELGSSTQPATIGAAARALGLRPIEPAHTVYLSAASAAGVP